MVKFTRKELELVVAGLELLEAPEAEVLASRVRVLMQPGGDARPAMRPQLAADEAEATAGLPDPAAFWKGE